MSTIAAFAAANRRRACRRRLFVRGLVLFFLAGWFVQVPLDAVVEVRLLEHFSQLPGAQVRGQCLLFVNVEVVRFGLVAARMGRSVELLAIDFFLFDQACTRRIR